MPEKLKVYSPAGHANPKYWQRFLVHPVRAFWGDGSDRWDEYAPSFEFYKDLFVLTETVEEADVVFLPMAINYYVRENKLDLAKQTCELAVSNNLKCYIWIEGDYDFRVKFKGAVYLKNASFKSKNIQNEIIRAGDTRDILNEHFVGKLTLVEKTDKPTIGFVGMASYPAAKLPLLLLRNLFSKLKYALGIGYFSPPDLLPAVFLRGKILKAFNSDTAIETNFVTRNKFAPHINNQNLREEFIENLNSNLYSLCIRGQSNYSLRFYEALSLGRIPVLIDTDCKLPFENEIDWDSAILRIKDWKSAPKILSEFHKSNTNEQLKTRQHQCREVYENYLTDKAFYSQLILNKYFKINPKEGKD